MKSSLTVALLYAILQVVKPEADSQYLSEITFCLQKLNLDRSQIEEIIGNEENDIPEDNLQFNEFAACYLEKKGYLNAGGEINFTLVEAIVERHGGNSFVQKFNPKIAEEFMKACKNVPRGNTKGQTAVKAFNCLTRKVKEFEKEG